MNESKTRKGKATCFEFKASYVAKILNNNITCSFFRCRSNVQTRPEIHLTPSCKNSQNEQSSKAFDLVVVETLRSDRSFSLSQSKGRFSKC